MLKIKSAAFFRNFHKIAPKTFQPTFFPKRDRIENVKVYQNYSGNAELPYYHIITFVSKNHTRLQYSYRFLVINPFALLLVANLPPTTTL